jgi:hypothetical protein
MASPTRMRSDPLTAIHLHDVLVLVNTKANPPAPVKTSLRHLAGEKLHDTQDAIYGCRKVDGEWLFVSHLSLEVTQAG